MNSIYSYNEEELVVLLKNRDSKAFNYLYDNYSGALYTVIVQTIDNIDVADVLQEVFINIWRKIDTYDPRKGRLFTWMLNIARNASIDRLRSKNYRNIHKQVSIDGENNMGVENHETSMNVDNIGFKKVLQQLNSDYRVLIDLAYFKGYTHEEISKIQNVPLGTVKTRIRAALLQLRQLLK